MKNTFDGGVANAGRGLGPPELTPLSTSLGSGSEACSASPTDPQQERRFCMCPPMKSTNEDKCVSLIHVSILRRNSVTSLTTIGRACPLREVLF